MSIKVFNLVWERFPGGGNKLIAMLALADWAGDDGARCYPSYTTLAEKIRLSRRQATRLIAELIAGDYLELVATGQNNNSGFGNQYKIKIETLRKCSRLDGKKDAPNGAKLSPLEANAIGDKSGANGDKFSSNGDIKTPESEAGHQSLGEPLEPLYNRYAAVDKLPKKSKQPAGAFCAVQDHKNRLLLLSNYITQLRRVPEGKNAHEIASREIARVQAEIDEIKKLPGIRNA